MNALRLVKVLMAVFGLSSCAPYYPQQRCVVPVAGGYRGYPQGGFGGGYGYGGCSSLQGGGYGGYGRQPYGRGPMRDNIPSQYQYGPYRNYPGVDWQGVYHAR